ncbi:Nucleic-acid-binding protein from transposon X-element [Eumeta japonica]|uniref:Nucleic-acid-binding protein from transposon X-element n=1 Tax=Eumeta variegata TaxID=151549 RepID=A0A4C1XM84_EUMVA|nr:Nucleic-acid-binding protein from transposon X-element [Eumeta japonica]
MSALTRLDVSSEQEFLKASPSLPCCTTHSLMTYLDRRLASNSRYSLKILRFIIGIGVTLDKNLHFRDNIERVRKIAIYYGARLGTMLGRKSKLSRSNKRTIYKMCIRTVRTYASPIFAHADPKALYRLQVIQNIFVETPQMHIVLALVLGQHQRVAVDLLLPLAAIGAHYSLTLGIRSDTDSDSDPGWSDVSDDHSNFTPVQRRKTSRAKPEPASFLAQATDGSTYFRISLKKANNVPNSNVTIPAKSTKSFYDAPESWRKLFQPSAASQGVAPTAAKNTNKSDEADGHHCPHPCAAWPEATTRVHIEQGSGLKLQTKTVADFRNLQNLGTQHYAFHTYSLKEEWEIRVVLKGVPRKIQIEEVKEDLHSQNFPVQSVRRILNRSREPLDLVLISGTAEANDKTTKAAFFKIKSVCSLSGIRAEQPRKRALTGQCHNCQSNGHSSKHCFNRERCDKCLSNHCTALCTRNEDTDGPPACVLCNFEKFGATFKY